MKCIELYSVAESCLSLPLPLNRLGTFSVVCILVSVGDPSIYASCIDLYWPVLTNTDLLPWLHIVDFRVWVGQGRVSSLY